MCTICSVTTHAMIAALFAGVHLGGGHSAIMLDSFNDF